MIVHQPISPRPAALAAARARLAARDWPSPLAVADAILAQVPALAVPRTRRAT